MEAVTQHPVVRQFVKFGLIGAMSAAIDWTIYLVLTRFLGVFYLAAKAGSFIVSAANSYVWNRRWTFRSDNPEVVAEFTKFLVVATVGLGLNTFLMFLVVGLLKQSDLLGLVVATGLVAIWNFTVNRCWTFKK